uniref:Conserved oligomeric Golgi complex subunit 4 n=1 Tax=Macrostomum lignano TaxID=282301 RepID=A0A1I8FB28_9PLAT
MRMTADASEGSTLEASFGSSTPNPRPEQCEKARIAASSAAGQDGGAWAAQQLLQLYEAVAASVEVHQPLVGRRFYGPGHLFASAAGACKIEVDAQAKRIVDRFRSLRAILDSRVRLARTSATRHQQSQQQYGPGASSWTPSQLDAVLSELAVLSSRTELYLEICFSQVLSQIGQLPIAKGGGSGRRSAFAELFQLASADATCAALNRAADVAEAQLIGALRIPSRPRISLSGWGVSRQSAGPQTPAGIRHTSGAGRGTREKLLSCLQAMDRWFGRKLWPRIVNEGVECLTEILAAGLSHVITEEELLAYEASDPGWRRPAFALANWLTDSSACCCRRCLTPCCKVSVLASCVLRAEKLIARKTVQQAGGTAADRPEGPLFWPPASAPGPLGVSEIDWPGLSQTRHAAGSREPGRADRLAGPNLSWPGELTPAERARHVLALRVDFRQDDVRETAVVDFVNMVAVWTLQN